MVRTAGLLSIAAILAFALGAAHAGAVKADGEAGLVIQHGDGTLENYCVAFEGTGIDGDELLRAAAVSFDQLNGLVCSVGDLVDESCPGASNLASCTCKCRPGSGDCVYWSYFSKERDGPWVYSITGFTAQSSGNGEMQAWRWGPGGPSSAPPPAEVSFEQVCGHPAGSLQTPPTVTTGPKDEPTMTDTATVPATAVAAETEDVPNPTTIVSGVSAFLEEEGDGPRNWIQLAAFAGAAAILGAGTLVGLRRRSQRGR